jgi:deazaflavin-dependent oxidoreductase (nitroreductase family)
MMTNRNDWNTKVIEEFRANGGKVAQFGELPLLLLHHTGARTGKKYTNPLAYLQDGDSMAIFASKAGADMNPDWYHNLKAHPDVEVEIGDGATFAARASEALGTERDRLYNKQAERAPAFTEYQAKTSRKIPVILLERV